MMSWHLCFECAREEGYSTSAETDLLLETEYQLEKYVKHTRPERIYEVNSLFKDPSTATYADFIINTAAAGSVEVDDLGRTNFIWVAGQYVGATYIQGEFEYPNDSIRLVLPFDADKVHAFPFSSTGLTDLTCRKCGRSVLG